MDSAVPRPEPIVGFVPLADRPGAVADLRSMEAGSTGWQGACSQGRAEVLGHQIPPKRGKTESLPMNLFRAYETEFIPFRLQRNDQPARHYFGGTAPRDVFPRHVESVTRFLAVLALTDTTSVAVFTTLDDDEYSPFYYGNVCKLEVPGPESEVLIQFAQFAPSKDQPAGTMGSVLPRMVPVFGPPSHDPDLRSGVGENVWKVEADHKVGGMPYFESLDDMLLDAALEMMASGYIHLLQLGFPTRLDARIDGNWLFAECNFHIFAKACGGAFEFKYLVG
ncbi:MAG: hypothetical protein HY898_17590 [Deltaproteobacteria bacterium]|nr:hypothetical protein [Deltaproteobacteria bacterium]